MTQVDREAVESPVQEPSEEVNATVIVCQSELTLFSQVVGIARKTGNPAAVRVVTLEALEKNVRSDQNA